MADGGNKLFVAGGGVQHYEGFVGFILIVVIYCFGKTGKIPVSGKSFGGSNVNGGIWRLFGNFGNKNYIFFCILSVQGIYDTGNALR